MSKNLPVRTRSRNIQKQHTRRYDSGKVKIVNRGVSKPIIHSRHKTTIKPKLTPRRFNPGKELTFSDKISSKLTPRRILTKSQLFNNFNNYLQTSISEGHDIGSLIGWINRSDDIFMDELETKWKDYISDNYSRFNKLSPSKFFNEYLDYFIEEFENDDGFGGQDRVHVASYGDFNKIQDLTLRTAFLKASESQGYGDNIGGMFHDPFNGEILEYKGDPFGEGAYGLNNDKMQILLQLTYDDLNPISMKLFKILKRTNIPYVLIDTSEGQLISIPKNFTEDINKNINSEMKALRKKLNSIKKPNPQYVNDLHEEIKLLKLLKTHIDYYKN
jgi:hypothetical protein